MENVPLWSEQLGLQVAVVRRDDLQLIAVRRRRRSLTARCVSCGVDGHAICMAKAHLGGSAHLKFDVAGGWWSFFNAT